MRTVLACALIAAGLIGPASADPAARITGRPFLASTAAAAEQAIVQPEKRIPMTILLNGEVLKEMRLRVQAGDAALVPAVAQLRRQADAAMTGTLWTVTGKPFAAPSGDKHDYVSLASYFWPDETKSNGLPYVSRDGQVNPETHQYDRYRLSPMCEAVHALSLAYYLTGEERYAERAAAQLRAWFLDEATRMTPNLRYAQMIRGKQDGSAFGIIETADLTRVVDGVALLEGSPHWPAQDHERLRKWFGEYLDWLLTSAPGQKEGRAPQNHGTFYDVQVVDFAFFVARPELARKVLEEVKVKRIASHIEPDGSQPRELARTRGYSYAVLNLAGLFRLARLGEHVGVDLWTFKTDDGRSIRRALDWLMPYTTGEKEWTHQQITRPQHEQMIPLFREAARVYMEPAYEKAITRLTGPQAAREKLTALLLNPPLPAMDLNVKRNRDSKEISDAQ
jgi:hypothetical protein